MKHVGKRVSTCNFDNFVFCKELFREMDSFCTKEVHTTELTYNYEELWKPQRWTSTKVKKSAWSLGSPISTNRLIFHIGITVTETWSISGHMYENITINRLDQNFLVMKDYTQSSLAWATSHRQWLYPVNIRVIYM